MKIYALKSCDTCRKALKALDAAGADYTLADVRTDGIALDDLKTIIAEVGAETAVNRRSTTWRALDDAEKAGLDADKAKDLISAHPTLLKRPAILGGGKVTVGWDKTAQAAWL